MPDPKIFEVEALNFRYGEKPVIRNMSFGIGKGLVALLGPNGSGKTTLIELLAGLKQAESGSIRFRGIPLEEIDIQNRAREIAWLPQENSVLFPLTVEELVLLGRIPYTGGLGFESGEDWTVLKHVLELVGISKISDQRFDTLSGGQRQCALLALRLAQEPRVLLLDEPQTHMDISVQFRISGMLRNLALNESKTILMATHDFNLAARFCDRIIMLNEGEIVADGTPEEALTEETIWEVFKCRAVVDRSPVTGHPRVTVISH